MRPGLDDADFPGLCRLETWVWTQPYRSRCPGCRLAIVRPLKITPTFLPWGSVGQELGTLLLICFNHYTHLSFLTFYCLIYYHI